MADIQTLPHGADEVRRFDNDRFLCALFAPAERRAALLALYAFNLEIARVRESVTEMMAGLIRLQWWRETIEGIYQGEPPRPHPVVVPLAEAVAAHGLSKEAFDRLIDTRERDLQNEPPENVMALEEYADGTSGELTRLALEVLGARGGADRTAGRHVGIAWALTGLLRAVPFHAGAGRLYLPADLLARHAVETRELFELKSSPALRAVAAEIAARARDHVARARAVRRDVSREALPALLPAVLAEGYLKRLERVGFDPFDPRVEGPKPLRQARLMVAAGLGRY